MIFLYVYLNRVAQTQDHHHLVIFQVKMILHTVNSAVVDKHLENHLISKKRKLYHLQSLDRRTSAKF